MTTAEIVKNSQSSHFQLFRNNHFIYKTDNGFYFSVPLEDVGKASMLANDKTIFFMRWIRKQVETNTNGLIEQELKK